MNITYGSVCSGIEAASVAWEPLGMKASWFSQFDPQHNYSRGPDFPSAVLAHHWPEVVNLGDMTKISDLILTGEVTAPDILVGGTPCQAFSVAGARAGLSDPRGQLTLSYVDLANAIDKHRAATGKRAAVIVWENVPGVLSSKDNAFGCFLGALSGEDCELIPPGKKWANAGCVFGPQRTVSWIVKDAQYFGVAQRRRRVFVVASADPRIDTTEILFESEGVRRDSAPSREAGSKVAGNAGQGFKTGSHWDGEQYPHPSLSQSFNTGGIGQSNQEVFSQRGAGLVQCFGGGNTTGQIDVATKCTAHGNRQDFDTETFAVQSVNGSVTHTLTAGGHDASEDGTGRGTPVICYPINTQLALRGSETSNSTREGIGLGNNGDPSFTLLAAHHHAIATDMQVRRLMPVECERLQGFLDGHTDIGADGPRYKAIGNSMAVPVMKWIGERIMMQLAEEKEPEKKNSDYGGSNTPVEIKDLWMTPPEIYAHLNAEFGFSVDLAASGLNKLHENYITAEMNTLGIDWCGMFGRSWGWLNPPYSSIGPFIEKAIDQQERGFGTVMLVPSDTSVGWFSLALTSVSEVRFITGGRLSFIRADTNKPVSGNNKGSMLLIFSPHKIGSRQFGTVDRDTLMAPL